MIETFESIRTSGNLLFESIRGSHLFGLADESSDTDTYGIFIGPQDWVYGLGLDKSLTIKSEKNDDSWNEIEKFFHELGRSNPDALAALFTPPEHILSFNPILQPLWDIRESLLTKECFKPFSNYSMSQIKKAKGLKKAINTDPKEVKARKSILDFCYVGIGCGVWTMTKYLRDNNLDASKCGLTRLPNGIETFALYYDETGEIGYRGLIKEESSSTQLRMSSIPKDQAANPVCYFQYNAGAYSSHCTDYKRYHDWVKNRNEARYVLNKGFDFDSKNMCHCVRLMTMAKEIASGQGMKLDRTHIDRDWLLSIKNHEVTYTELMEYVEKLETEMLQMFESSTLPDKPDIRQLDRILINIRKSFYGE